MIHLLDYGAGNITSVHSAFKRCGAEISVVSDSFDNTAIRSLVIPGVGSFASAMLHIRQTGWEQRILTEAARGTKILGICLGMQILFEEEMRHGATLYDNLVSLGPSAVLQVVFAAPSDADEERDCGLQRALASAT